MSLLDRIKTDLMTARKQRDLVARQALTTLLGEVVYVGKTNGNRDTTDAEAIIVIKKFTKNLSETISYTDNSKPEYATLVDEMKIVSQYLPQQLTNIELTGIIQQFIVDNPQCTIADIMPHLKQTYPSRYDGGAANKIARQLLAGQ